MSTQELNGMVADIYKPFFDMIGNFVNTVLSIVAFVLVVFIVLFVLTSRINFFKLSPEYLKGLYIRFLPYDLLRWWLYDLLTVKERTGAFDAFGFTLFCGRQGGGKTTSMIRYAINLKERFPKMIIVANFDFAFADYRMRSWRDFLEIRNGTDGVLFLIDEVHSEFSSNSSKDFPESILSEISQQRKQRIKICATAQVYSRVAKPIREQAFSVVLCSTFYGRFTRNREYEASEFIASGDGCYKVKKGVRPIWRSWWVQSNALRECFDTYEKIERMKSLDFIPRADRSSN